jgi:Uma2 family endonuclease
MATSEPSEILNLRDLLRQLGDIAPERVRFRPAPGTATAADLRTNKLCELIDGTLVEKPMEARESRLTAYLIYLLQLVVLPKNLGTVLGPDAAIELDQGLVRLPDIAYVSWEALPNRRLPAEPVLTAVPDLMVDLVSAGNTPAEMTRKRQEYFRTGVRLAWLIDPTDRTVSVYTSARKSTLLSVDDTLDGGEVLPDFAYRVRQLFAELDRRG